MKKATTILAAICLVAGALFAADERLNEVSVARNVVFTNSVTKIVDLADYYPHGYFSIQAVCHNAGTVSNITTYVSNFGPDNVDSHTNMSTYVWTTNTYSAVSANAASTNVLEQAYQVPARYMKVVIDPGTANASSNILDAILIVQ